MLLGAHGFPRGVVLMRRSSRGERGLLKERVAFPGTIPVFQSGTRPSRGDAVWFVPPLQKGGGERSPGCSPVPRRCLHEPGTRARVSGEGERPTSSIPARSAADARRSPSCLPPLRTSGLDPRQPCVFWVTFSPGRGWAARAPEAPPGSHRSPGWDGLGKARQETRPGSGHLFKGPLTPEPGDLSPALFKVNASPLSPRLCPPVRLRTGAFSPQGSPCRELPWEREDCPFSQKKAIPSVCGAAAPLEADSFGVAAGILRSLRTPRSSPTDQGPSRHR